MNSTPSTQNQHAAQSGKTCRNLLAVFFLAALTTLAGTLSAASLYVPNSSFESQPTPFADPRIDSWQKPPQPATFDTNVFGAWENLAGVFQNPASTNATHIDNCDGNQLAYLFSYPQVAIFQDYNSTDWSNAMPTHAFNRRFEAGKSYTLTVGLTSSSVEPLTPGATIQLSLYYRDGLSNIVTVAATTVTYDTNVFTNLTHLVDFQVKIPGVQATDPCAGQNIGIKFESTVAPDLLGGVWDLENVRLTENICVPNFSFESQATPFADPRIDSWQKAPQPATFDTNVFGAWDNLTGVFMNPGSTNQYHIDNCDGNQLAYLFSYPQVAIFQDYNSTDWSNATPTHAFNAVFEPGKSYTLTVGLTSSSVEPLTPGATMQLRLYYRDGSNDMATVGATTVTYDTGVFTNLTHLLDFQVKVPGVRTTDPWAGQNIGIQFESTVAPDLLGGVWDLDNVRLAENVAPALNHLVQTNGHFSFNVQSEPGLSFELQATSNLTTQGSNNWSGIGTLTNVTGTTSFTDPTTNLNRRFYRLRAL